MINILLADNHHLMREGLRAVFEREQDLTVVAEAEDGITALRLVEALQPDVMVLDITMPGLNGLSMIQQVRTRTPGTQVVVLTVHAHEAYVREALCHGALGYVLKQDHACEVVKAVRKVACGRAFLSASITAPALDAGLQHTGATTSSPYQTLTPREQEVMQLTAEGHTAVEVAARLFISPRTVEAHRANLKRKLGLSKQADLIRYAFQQGLMPIKRTPAHNR